MILITSGKRAVDGTSLDVQRFGFFIIEVTMITDR